MLVRELDLGDGMKGLLESAGVRELYPPQELAVKAGVMAGRNMILCTPTASGKTIAAELGMMKAIERGRKAVYIVPLRALAYEKREEFGKYERLGYKVRLEVGDLDAAKYRHKPDFDIMVATAEKCDSILRSKPEWFKGTGIIVFDEIHLIASDRGPVYEILCSKFRNLYPDVQVLGLSATVGNASELAAWLSAELVTSDWRPVALKEEVAVKGDEGLTDVVAKSLKGGQVMVFVNSRKSAEAVAEKLGRELKILQTLEAAKVAEDIEDVINPATRQCLRLGGCVRSGTAFHHAGLVNEQRAAVERGFKDGFIKVVVATPTLAAGVNLPSRTVVLRDVKRYADEGLAYIDVLEYKQMVGRAGRPRYDDRGIAITLAKDEDEADYIVEHYIGGTPEDIVSRLGVHPVLRFHVLASVASGFTRTREALVEFMRSTFFGHQYGVRKELEDLLDKIVGELGEWGFVKHEGRFLMATEVGGRVSELYIDPLTAHTYIGKLNEAEAKGMFEPVGVLEVLCDAAEMPPLSVKGKEEGGLWQEAYSLEGVMLRDLSGFGLDYQFLNRFKTALMFREWIDERTEEEILESYGVAPGQLNMKLQNLEWLCYAAAELARILKLKKAHPALKKLEARVKYGVREELVPLVSVRGIGRVRARKLYAAGVKTMLQLKATPRKELAALIGEKTAEKVKRELESA